MEQSCTICLAYGKIIPVSETHLSSTDCAFTYLNLNFKNIRTKGLCLICLHFLSHISRFAENFIVIGLNFDRKMSPIRLGVGCIAVENFLPVHLLHVAKFTRFQWTGRSQITNELLTNSAVSRSVLYIASKPPENAHCNAGTHLSNQSVRRLTNFRPSCDATTKQVQSFTIVTSTSEGNADQHISDQSDLESHLRCHTIWKLPSYALGTSSLPIEDDLTTRTDEKSHRCTRCNKSFSHKSALESHLAIHLMDKPHQCTVCSKSFHLKLHLKAHLYHHTGKNLHPCNICGKCFSSQWYLKTHLHTHANDKLCQYQCVICKKLFGQKYNLISHLMIHCGDIANGKLHHCALCNRTFNLKCNLRFHLQAHHADEKRYRCAKCDRTFTRRSTFNAHLVSHTYKSFI